MASEFKPDKVPRGALTCQQWMRKWQITQRHTCTMLQRGIDAGMMKTKKFRIRTNAGLRPVPHYWEVKSKARS